jgi:aarF domain-containing kinase
MSGKRLLDAIQLFNVAKSVAGKHLAVRQRQLDVFTRTSSLTKGVKQQTDNLILTAQAAAALAKRFNEPSPPTPSHPEKPYDQGPIAEGHEIRAASGRDESYNTPVSSGSGERSSNLSAEEARKLQRQAEFQIPSKQADHSLDGSSSGLNVSQSQDTFYAPSSNATLVFSALPRVKVPKVTGVVQEAGPNAVDGKIDSDVFYSPVRRSNGEPVSESKVSSESDELPEDMMRSVFHSPKVANQLLSKRQNPYTLNAPSKATSPSQTDVEIKGESEGSLRVPVQQAQKNAAPESPASASAPEKEEMEQLGSSLAESMPSSQTVSDLTHLIKMIRSLADSSLGQHGGASA